MGILAELTGAIEAASKFRRMGEYAPRELLNAMKRCGTLKARVIKSAMKRKRTGLLYKSIGNRTKETKPGRILDLAGARRGFRVAIAKKEKRKLTGLRLAGKGAKQTVKKIVLKRGRGVGEGSVLDPARYAHLADKGHAKGKGKSAAKGQGFMEAADKQTRPQIVAEIKAALVKIGKAT